MFKFKKMLLFLSLIILYSCVEKSPTSMTTGTQISLKISPQAKNHKRDMSWPNRFNLTIVLNSDKFKELSYSIEVEKNDSIYQAIAPLEVPAGVKMSLQGKALINNVAWQFTDSVTIISGQKNLISVDLSPNYQQLLDAAWLDFTNNSYLTAIEKFQYLIYNKDLDGRTYSGMGWCSIFTQEADSATAYFKKAQQFPLDLQTKDEIFAGLSISRHLVKDYSSCIIYADSVQTNWRHRYKTQITYEDILLNKASSYYALAKFSEALKIVQVFKPSFKADLNTIEGRSLLATEIEFLITQRKNLIL